MTTGMLDPTELSAMMEQLLAAGFEPPFYLAVIAKNGEMGLGVWKEGRTGAGLDFQLLASHSLSGEFVLPINMMIVDHRGEAARIVFDANRKPIILH